MTPAQLDFWTIAAFILALLAGWGLMKVRESRRMGPRQKAAERLAALLASPGAGEGRPSGDAAPAGDALFQEYATTGNTVRSWMAQRRRRLINICGTQIRHFVAIVSVSIAISVLAMCWLLPLASWWAPLLLAADPLAILAVGALWAESRYKKRFLQQLPDALDLIIRAVRAGVPANQAIGAAGKEFADPLHTEFTQMGDGLRLGIDLKDVLADAQARIAVPEFSFFAVCLLLQRETGGQLTETLENLAYIIRARRDLVLKARVLTAESRTASLFIAAVPFLLVGALWFLNHDYIAPLFTTAGGLTLLKTAMALVTVGLALIFWLSNLKV